MISQHDRNMDDLNTPNNKEVMVTQLQLAKRQKKNSSRGLQELPSAINIPNNKEGMVTHPQLSRRQRKKPALTEQEFLWTS